MRARFESIDPVWEEAVHGPYTAIPVRAGEPITAHLLTHSQGLVPVPVWRLSPSGVEFIHNDGIELTLGEPTSLMLTVGKQELQVDGLVARIDQNFHKGTRVGVSYNKDAKRSGATTKNAVRYKIRWGCHHQFFPTGTLRNPGRFSDKVLFSVKDISLEGMSLCTSLRNKFLLRGLMLQGRICLPMAENFSFVCIIVSNTVKTINGAQMQVIGVKFKKLSKSKIRAIGHYIAKFGSNSHHLPSPKRLKLEGYGTVDATDAIEWDTVRSAQEYQKVLELRRLAFRATEGWPEDDTVLISDPFDERARILVARFRNIVVATVRVCFHEKTDTFEEELYFKFPDDFPPRDTLVEASRAAIHPEFRGTDMFMNLMRFAMMIGIQAKRRWFVQSTYENLAPLYKKIGFKEVGGIWMHPHLIDRKMQMFMVDALSVLQARYGNPFLYHAMVPLIEEFIGSSAYETLTKKERIRLELFKLTAPAFKIFTKFAHMKKILRSRSARP